MEQVWTDLLHQGLEGLSLNLAPKTESLLLQFLDKVLETNKVMNLTSITDKSEAIHKHLIDSLSVLMLKPLLGEAGQARIWTDIGSGAGFPGMVLALAVPEATLHLVESTAKKAHFLNTSAAELGLMKRVVVHNQRAELLTPWTSETTKSVPRGTKPYGTKNTGKMLRPLPSKPSDETKGSVSRGTNSGFRALSDAVFFRGVSKLASLVELGAPFLKMNGLLVAYKGPKAQEELLEAEKAMKEFRLSLVECPSFILPGTTESRTLVCLRKTGETLKRYPRMVGLAQKEPLL